MKQNMFFVLFLFIVFIFFFTFDGQRLFGEPQELVVQLRAQGESRFQQRLLEQALC